MKYCVSGRQSISVIAAADEIKMKYQDRNRAIDYITNFPDKTIIIEIPKDTIDVDWQLLQKYNEICTLVLCLYDLKDVAKCVNYNIKFYWAYPITSYYELKGILDLNPYYILLGAPLSFEVETIHNKTNAYIRLIANVAYNAYIPRENGVCGAWIRPEDVIYYEPYVNALEFDGVDLTAEKTLLHIYKDNKEWPGDLNFLIKNLNYNVDNRALPDGFGSVRIRCGQRCMKNNICHYCESAFKYARIIQEKYNETKTKDHN